GPLFHQDVVAAKLPYLDATKSGTVDQVQVIGHRVSKGSEAVLDAILLEVRLDTGRRHLGMEHREDEPPSSNEAVTDLAEQEAEVAQVLADERTEDRVEGASPDGERVVQVRLREGDRRVFGACDFQ